MNMTMVVPALSIFGAVITASVSYAFTKRRELETESRQRKIEHYTNLIEAISALGNQEPDGPKKYSHAYNKMILIAPQRVLNALHDLQHSFSKGPQPLTSPLIKALFLEIRRDLGIRPADDVSTFKVILMVPADAVGNKKEVRS